MNISIRNRFGMAYLLLTLFVSAFVAEMRSTPAARAQEGPEQAGE
jgi:hypothetical protein